MIYRDTNQAPRLDILRMPFLGRLLLWKHSRTAVQVLLFALVAVMLDGFWVAHWRRKTWRQWAHGSIIAA